MGRETDRVTQVIGLLRNFTALAVREHLRSEVERSDGSPRLTKNEHELVRFVCEGSFDWSAFLTTERKSVYSSSVGSGVGR